MSFEPSSIEECFFKSSILEIENAEFINQLINSINNPRELKNCISALLKSQNFYEYALKILEAALEHLKGEIQQDIQTEEIEEINGLRSMSVEHKLKSVPYNTFQDLDSLTNSETYQIPENDLIVKFIHPSERIIGIGDIHGLSQRVINAIKIYDFFSEEFSSSNTQVIFLGDYVDRGHESLKTFLTLLLLKMKFPNQITLLRGNHEKVSMQQTKNYEGFTLDVLKILIKNKRNHLSPEQEQLYALSKQTQNSFYQELKPLFEKMVDKFIEICEKLPVISFATNANTDFCFCHGAPFFKSEENITTFSELFQVMVPRTVIWSEPYPDFVSLEIFDQTEAIIHQNITQLEQQITTLNQEDPESLEIELEEMKENLRDLNKLKTFYHDTNPAIKPKFSLNALRYSRQTYLVDPQHILNLFSPFLRKSRNFRICTAHQHKNRQIKLPVINSTPEETNVVEYVWSVVDIDSSMIFSQQESPKLKILGNPNNSEENRLRLCNLAGGIIEFFYDTKIKKLIVAYNLNTGSIPQKLKFKNIIKNPNSFFFYLDKILKNIGIFYISDQIEPKLIKSIVKASLSLFFNTRRKLDQRILIDGFAKFSGLDLRKLNSRVVPVWAQYLVDLNIMRQIKAKPPKTLASPFWKYHPTQPEPSFDRNRPETPPVPLIKSHASN